MDSNVASTGSRVIGSADDHMIVDATDALLVDEALVIANMAGNPEVIAMELQGRVNHKDERAYVLLVMNKEEIHTLIGLMVESMLQVDPDFGPEIMTAMIRLIGKSR